MKENDQITCTLFSSPRDLEVSMNFNDNDLLSEHLGGVLQRSHEHFQATKLLLSSSKVMLKSVRRSCKTLSWHGNATAKA